MLENLVKARGGVVGDQLSGCAVDAAVGVIRALADLHALFWRHPVMSAPSLGRFSLATGVCANPKVPQVLAAGRVAYAAVLQVIPHDIAPAFLEQLPHAPVERLLAYAAGQDNTVCHQDVRLDNMIFLPAGDVFLLDWQRVAAGWNMMDVAQFIVFNVCHSTLDADTLQSLETRLLEVYATALTASPHFPAAEASHWTAAKVRDEYRIAVALHTLLDLPSWFEQQDKLERFRAQPEEPWTWQQLFSTPRMARLAPSIAGNLAAAYLRNRCSTPFAD